MGKIKTLFKLIKNDPKKINQAIMTNLAKSPISHLVPDKVFLRMQYRAVFGKKLNLTEPKTFNEKLQWLKLYDRNPEYCRLVDKYEVKKLISDTLGEEYIIPTLGVWDSFDDIDFDSLPDRFVLKCTHDSGSVVLCRDKATFDVASARAKLTKKLNSNLFWHGREWPYKDLKPRIIAEEYIATDGQDLRDYKFFCFGGKVKCFKIDFDRFVEHRANYYDINGSLLPFGEAVCPPDYEREIDVPSSLKKMVGLAEFLSSGKPFARVDFYEAQERIKFGEITFFPASGFGPFTPEEWDMTLGNWIALPNKKR